MAGYSNPQNDLQGPSWPSCELAPLECVQHAQFQGAPAGPPRFHGHPAGMNTGKRTTLPPVTPEDVQLRPELLRKTPTGHAWKCAHCGKFASSETQAGLYVCRDHGGVTPAQRDPVEAVRAQQEGREPPRRPGRPLEHGLYSKSEHFRVDRVVQEFRERQINPDDSEEDMLYLRAYIEVMKERVPDIDALGQLIEAVEESADALMEVLVELDGEESKTLSATDFLNAINRYQAYAGACKSVGRLLARCTAFTEGMEQRHERLVVLGKVRAETRLKDAAGRQLDLFTMLLRRFMVILGEAVTPEQLMAFQTRLSKEMEELPAAALAGGVRA